MKQKNEVGAKIAFNSLVNDLILRFKHMHQIPGQSRFPVVVPAKPTFLVENCKLDRQKAKSDRSRPDFSNS